MILTAFFHIGIAWEGLLILHYSIRGFAPGREGILGDKLLLQHLGNPILVKQGKHVADHI